MARRLGDRGSNPERPGTEAPPAAVDASNDDRSGDDWPAEDLAVGPESAVPNDDAEPSEDPAVAPAWLASAQGLVPPDAGARDTATRAAAVPASAAPANPDVDASSRPACAPGRPSRLQPGAGTRATMSDQVRRRRGDRCACPRNPNLTTRGVACGSTTRKPKLPPPRFQLAAAAFPGEGCSSRSSSASCSRPSSRAAPSTRTTPSTTIGSCPTCTSDPSTCRACRAPRRGRRWRTPIRATARGLSRSTSATRRSRSPTRTSPAGPTSMQWSRAPSSWVAPRRRSTTSSTRLRNSGRNCRRSASRTRSRICW